MNTEFKVKLTPKDDRAVYNQNLPKPIHLIFELALMHRNGIITVLPFSKYANPIFAQTKPNGKIRLLVDLKKVKTLIAENYTKEITQSALCQLHHNTSREVSILQAWLLPSLSLLADGGPTFMEIACLQKTCTRSQQICVCFFRLHAGVLGASC